MIGENVKSYPKVAREVGHAGHTIVNHTWSHPAVAALGIVLPRLLAGGYHFRTP